MPPFKFLKLMDQKFDFLDFEEYERLIVAARAEDEPKWEAFVLMVGKRGCGWASSSRSSAIASTSALAT